MLSRNDQPEESVYMYRVDALVTQNFIEDVPLPGQGPGRDGLKHAVPRLLTAFPDMTWRTHERDPRATR
jgi:hypothetical protein